MKILLLLVLVSAMLTGCDQEPVMDAKPDAEAVAMEFFERFRAGLYEEVLSLYADEFWDNISKEYWLRILPNVENELGPLRECVLITWRQEPRIETSGIGNLVQLAYQCEHGTYQASVTFTIFVPHDGGDVKITNQNYNSLGFLLE